LQESFSIVARKNFKFRAVLNNNKQGLFAPPNLFWTIIYHYGIHNLAPARPYFSSLWVADYNGKEEVFSVNDALPIKNMKKLQQQNWMIFQQNKKELASL
jgi:hypothetical protein